MRLRQGAKDSGGTGRCQVGPVVTLALLAQAQDSCYPVDTCIT